MRDRKRKKEIETYISTSYPAETYLAPNFAISRHPPTQLSLRVQKIKKNQPIGGSGKVYLPSLLDCN